MAVSQPIRRSNDKPRFSVFLNRGLRLRCPECGISPLFTPMRKARSLWDWFTPLDGCPRCGYAYERESGYFLLAIWGLNYGLVAGTGLAVGLLLQHWFHPPLLSPIWLILLFMPVMSFLLARHAKSIFLAVDHYLDPHLQHRSSGGPDGS
jgi:uncharacterized protein (DUF983 family)